MSVSTPDALVPLPGLPFAAGRVELRIGSIHLHRRPQRDGHLAAHVMLAPATTEEHPDAT